MFFKVFGTAVNRKYGFYNNVYGIIMLGKGTNLVAMPVIERKAQEYITQDGRTPFRDWLLALKDARAQAKITKAVTQMEAGNFGDHKAITGGKGLHERRIDYGPGYRIYYITEGDELIILFAGSDKPGQQSAIDSAKGYLADYKVRKPVARPQQQNGGQSISEAPGIATGSEVADNGFNP